MKIKKKKKSEMKGIKTDFFFVVLKTIQDGTCKENEMNYYDISMTHMKIFVTVYSF